MFDKTYLEPSMARANQLRATQACRAKTPQIAEDGNFCMPGPVGGNKPEMNQLLYAATEKDRSAEE